MQIVFLIAVCFISNALAETPQTEVTPENITTNTPKTINVKKEKFSYLLNLLKSAITDEDGKQNTDINNEKSITETDKGIISNTSEIKQIDTEDVKPENKEEKIDNDAAFGKTFDKILTKISNAIENKPNNNTKMKETTNNTEIPSMIQIFKPKPSTSNAQLKNNFKTKQRKFNVPCHRAADVLEPPTQTPKILQGNIATINKDKSNIIPSQEKPVKISMDYKDVDESVKMLFKPKAISLMQLYGNILKKITITVLVPYHISKMTS